MSPGEQVPGSVSDAAAAPQDAAPIPDEDGPHDVPDEAVIEATLPTGPVAGLG